MSNSITIRIFTIFWLIFTLITMFLLIIYQLDSEKKFQVTNNDLNQEIILKDHAEIKIITYPSYNPMWWKCLFPIIDRWIPLDQSMILVTSQGQVVSTQNNQIKMTRDFISQLANTEHLQKKKYEHSEIIGPLSIDNKGEHYQIYQIRPVNDISSNFIYNGLSKHPSLLLFITALISTPLLLWLARDISKPIFQLKRAANEVINGNLKQYPELETSSNELLEIGISFNKMISILKNKLTSQQRLLSDISHELRTPLTRLKLAAAIIRKRHRDENELVRIDIEIQRLNSMISNLLVFSRNQHQTELLLETLEANNLWKDILHDAQFEAEQMGKNLKFVSLPKNWILIGNPSALNSALENVIRNALYYSVHQILIEFSADQNGITITIDDDGPGVSKNDREKIFEPFFRVNRNWNKESNNAGLGLAIMKSAIVQHQGSVTAEDSPLGGLRLIIWLPLVHQ